MNSSNVPQIELSDVLKAFWQAIRPRQISMYFAIFAYSIVSVLDLIVPLVYKRFFDVLATEENRNFLAPQLIKFLIIILIIHGIVWIMIRNLISCGARKFLF